MAESQNLDLVVIGGGPAGYVAAIRAAQLGMKVACVERDKLGGVCNNWGCIPTKALLAGAEFYHRLQHGAADLGIQADNVRHDWSKVIGRSRNVADTGAKGVGSLFRKHKITHVEGHAFIPKAGTVEIYAKDDTARKGKPSQTLTTKRILIATGAVARSLPGADFDGDRIIGAKEAMSLPQQPKKLLVIGAGAIGMEFAYFYNAFGTEVTVVEMLDRVLPIEDHDVSAEVKKAFEKQGIKVHTGHKTLKVEKTGNGIKATIAPVEDPHLAKAPAPSEKGYSAATAEKAKDASPAGKEITIETDKVLVAIGVKGRYDGLFDEKLGLELFKDHIKVDPRKPGATYETNVKGIYAVGDVIGPPWLAHVASEEAIVCVERMAAGNGHHAVDVDYDSVPGCTYCHPQVASIGLTEAKCKEAGIDYTVGKFPFMASGKARAMGETAGFIKLITSRKHGEILGCHMVGENVTELIAEIGLARRLEATAEEVIATMHAHPTLSEAVHESALGTQGRMIHF